MMTVDKHLTPLCFLPNGILVCYKYGMVVLLNEGKIIRAITIFHNLKERFLGRSSLLHRLLRLGVRASVAIDDESIIISIGNILYELDLTNGTLSDGYYCGEGIRPLVLTIVDGIQGFDNGIYFGGYLGNKNKKPVSIYQRVATDKWKTVYTFPQGTINHVHNIVPDPYRKCLWAFTGDFEESAAIWKITENYNNVELIACNNQKYRACIAYAFPEGLLYATDAPFADDYIYLLNPVSMECKELFPIDGSGIYGCRWKERYVFSSTVEGDGRNMSRTEWLFTRKRGAGIKDDYVHMYMGNLHEGFKEIYKEKKDCMPYYTFQFGAFKFPAGVNNSDTLYYQPVATKGNDLRLMSMKWGDIIK